MMSVIIVNFNERIRVALNSGKVVASAIANCRLGVSDFRRLISVSVLTSWSSFYCRNLNAIVPLVVVAEAALEPHDRIGVIWKATPVKHPGFVNELIAFVVPESTGIWKTGLLTFILHRAVTRRVDVDGRDGIAFVTAVPG